MKEKLGFIFWKKLNEENRDILTQAEKTGYESSEDLDAGNSFDSTIASNNNNTPKSKNIGINLKIDYLKIETENESSKQQPAATIQQPPN
jgi:hypothetical protein